uniref:Uncharacterized protein n=1 Tax=Romanomermis culicivorax TaxID=13658 RepID=A0A915JFF6_ROMCU
MINDFVSGKNLTNRVNEPSSILNWLFGFWPQPRCIDQFKINEVSLFDEEYLLVMSKKLFNVALGGQKEALHCNLAFYYFAIFCSTLTESKDN